MPPSTSISKKQISDFIINMTAISLITTILLYFIFISFAEKNISEYFNRTKLAELNYITASITNELVESDFRSARNKLSLLKGPNTFDSFVIYNEKRELVDGTIDKDTQLSKVEIAVNYPKTESIHSYIDYYYSDTYYAYTKKIFLIYLAGFFLVFTAVSVLCVFKLIQYLNKNISDYEKYFDLITNNPDSDISDTKNPLLPTIHKLKDSLLSIRNQSNTIFQLEKNTYKFTLSQKLAHDIRSPISTLNLISAKIEDPEIKSLQLAVVDQINSIANDLLNQSKSTVPLSSITEATGKESLPFLKKMFQNLEKEYQFKTNAISQKIIFEIDYEVLENNSVSQKLTSVIYTSINNFIQNSIDATKADDTIKITVNRNIENKIEVCVIDTGKGIPTTILKRLGTEALSYGKANIDQIAIDDNQTVTSGNGIALFNANKELTENGAKLVINSVENKGTEIRIII